MGGRGTFAAGNNAAYQEFLILNIEYNYNAKDMHSREYPAMLIQTLSAQANSNSFLAFCAFLQQCAFPHRLFPYAIFAWNCVGEHGLISYLMFRKPALYQDLPAFGELWVTIKSGRSPPIPSFICYIPPKLHFMLNNVLYLIFPACVSSSAPGFGLRNKIQRPLPLRLQCFRKVYTFNARNFPIFLVFFKKKRYTVEKPRKRSDPSPCRHS